MFVQLTRQVCSGKAFGMKDYRKTHQERENMPSVQCPSWSVLFISRSVEALLTVVRYNSPAQIKHARNLPRHMHQVHGHCKDHFLRVLTILLTHAQRLPLPRQRNVIGSLGRMHFTRQRGSNGKRWDISSSDGSYVGYVVAVVHSGIIVSYALAER